METAIITTITTTIHNHTAKTIFKLADWFTPFSGLLNQNLDKISKSVAVWFIRPKTAMPRPQGEYFWRSGLFAQKRGLKTYPHRQNSPCGVCNPHRQTFWRTGGFCGGVATNYNDYNDYRS